jgi:uncharacterized membrane protein HdeD (DUF308 family)/CheY-like chemotaxis protein
MMTTMSRLSVSTALKAEGYHVAAYTDGASALKGFRTAPPGLAILDIKTPHMDGMETLRQLRAKSNLPLILLTSTEEVSDEVYAFQKGADDFIRKPFSQRLLVERVKAVLRRASPKDGTLPKRIGNILEQGAFAAYAFVDGVFAIVSAVRAARERERWGYLLLEGIVDIAAAAVAVFWPGITVVAFVFVVAFWAIFTRVLELMAAFRLDFIDGRGWLIFGGIVSVLYGVLLIIAPMIGAVVLTWWLGAYALVCGVSLVVLAFKLRERLENLNPA